MMTSFPPFAIFHRWFLHYFMLILKPFNRVSTELYHLHFWRKISGSTALGKSGDTALKKIPECLFCIEEEKSLRQEQKTAASKSEIEIIFSTKEKTLSSQRSSGYTTSATRHQAITPCIMRGQIKRHSCNAVTPILRAGHFQLMAIEW